MRTLYVTDLDGTLLGPDSRVSDLQRSLLNEAISRGALVTIATARTPATVNPLLSGIDIAHYVDAAGALQELPAIVMTGAATWLRPQERFERVTLMSADEAERVAAIFERQGLHPFIYCLEGMSRLSVYHPCEMSKREDAFYQERRRLPLKRFYLGQRPETLDKVALFFTLGNAEAVRRTCQTLREETDCAAAWYLDIFDPATAFTDIYAPGVSKAHAVEQLARRVGAERVVVFGDNLNDLPMLRMADVAVAMGNALPEVKREASVVIGNNASETAAVAHFILDDLLL